MSGSIECRLEDRDGSFVGFSVSRVLYQKRSEFQNIEIVESDAWGTVLIVNGHQQFTPIDEAYSTEMRAHVPIYSFPQKPKSALLIAGVSGTCLQELVKHESFDEIVSVDLDPELLAACKKYFDPVNSYSKPYDDRRVKMVFADGHEYLKQCVANGKTFDLIIRSTVVEKVCSDHVRSLNGPSFYEAAADALSPDGILILSTGIQTLADQPARDTIVQLRKHFPNVGIYTSTIPSFGQGTWTFTWASRTIPLDKIPLEVLEERFRAAPVSTQIYNSDFHWASFRLDNFHRYVARK